VLNEKVETDETTQITHQQDVERNAIDRTSVETPFGVYKSRMDRL
jgi:hypothetical protein